MEFDNYTMDIFIEKIVKKQKTGADYAKIAGVILLALVLFFAIGFLPSIVQQFSFLIIAGVLYGAYLLIRNMNVEYEYAVTNGDLDVDKIIAQKKRKRILSVHAKNFEILAKVKSDHYNHNYESIKNSIFAGTTKDSDDLYFAVFNHDGERTVLYFEPSEKMLKSFKKFNPSKIHYTPQS